MEFRCFTTKSGEFYRYGQVNQVDLVQRVHLYMGVLKVGKITVKCTSYSYGGAHL